MGLMVAKVGGVDDVRVSLAEHNAGMVPRLG